MPEPGHGSPSPSDDPAAEQTLPSASAADRMPPWLSPDVDVDSPPRISPGRLAAAAGSLLLVVALLAWALPWATGASWDGIVSSFSSLPGWALPTVAGLGAAAIGCEALTVRSAVRGSRYGTSLQGHAASNALALAVPGGSMLGMYLLGWILRRRGLALPVIITGVIAASLVETVITTVAIPLLGLGAYAVSSLLSSAGPQLPGAVWAGVAAAAGGAVTLTLTAVLLRRSVLTGLLDRAEQVMTFPSGDGGAEPSEEGADDAADGAGRRRDAAAEGGASTEHRSPRSGGPVTEGGRHPFARAVLEQRDRLVELLRKRAPALLLPTLLARVLQWAALLVAIDAVGAEIPLLLTVAVFALGRLLSLVPVTPGGAGVTETVGAAALVGLGVDAEASATAMLLLAVATLVVPLLLGGAMTAAAFTTAPDRRRTG